MRAKASPPCQDGGRKTDKKENAGITVSVTMQQQGRNCYLAETKTESSHRTLPLIDKVYKLLLEQKARQEQNKDGSATGKRNRVISSTKTATSDALLDISPYAVSLIQELQAEEPEGYDGFILHSGDKPIAEKTLWQRFDKILRGAGVPQCGLHSLRHTYATMLYEATGGDIKLVSQQVRHSDPSFTTRTYVHQRNERTKNIIQKIAF